jgi:hypothetical protein
MTDILNDFHSTLFEPGDKCDHGWHGVVDEALVKKAIELSGKPCCLVQDWVIWDLDFNDEQLEQVNSMGNLPTIVYARNVMEDHHYRFRAGDKVRSSLLKKLHENAFFETSNTMYILVGPGTRKSIKPEFVEHFFLVTSHLI